MALSSSSLSFLLLFSSLLVYAANARGDVRPNNQALIEKTCKTVPSKSQKLCLEFFTKTIEGLQGDMTQKELVQESIARCQTLAEVSAKDAKTLLKQKTPDAPEFNVLTACVGMYEFSVENIPLVLDDYANKNYKGAEEKLRTSAEAGPTCEKLLEDEMGKSPLTEVNTKYTNYFEVALSLVSPKNSGEL